MINNKQENERLFYLILSSVLLKPSLNAIPENLVCVCLIVFIIQEFHVTLTSWLFRKTKEIFILCKKFIAPILKINVISLNSSIDKPAI